LRRAALRTQEAEANQALQSAKHYERARAQLASDTAALERLDADAASAMTQLGVRQAAFNEAEAALLQNHALHVAGHLIEGEPCRACGSRDHPAPAHGSVEAGSVATTYQREKTALESARKRSEDARTQAAAARQLVYGIGQAILINGHAKLLAWVVEDDGVTRFLALQPTLALGVFAFLLRETFLRRRQVAADRPHTPTNR
jgi:hypothetical protein